jgi:hypothetical protein
MMMNYLDITGLSGHVVRIWLLILVNVLVYLFTTPVIAAIKYFRSGKIKINLIRGAEGSWIFKSKSPRTYWAAFPGTIIIFAVITGFLVLLGLNLAFTDTREKVSCNVFIDFAPKDIECLMAGF